MTATMRTEILQCDLWVKEAQGSPGWLTAGCAAHNVRTTERWARQPDAARDFRCDRGLGLRFVIEDDGEPPAMADLSGLARFTRGLAEAGTYAGEERQVALWEWLGGGQVAPLAVSAGARSDFSEDDYAAQAWSVARVLDGQVLATVTLHIDGRA